MLFPSVPSTELLTHFALPVTAHAFGLHQLLPELCRLFACTMRLRGADTADAVGFIVAGQVIGPRHAFAVAKGLEAKLQSCCCCANTADTDPTSC
jgi:hypothetical protein